MAHSLKPVGRIGQMGDTEAVRAALEEALEAHELVKVKFLEAKDFRREIAENLAYSRGALVVNITGNVALLYRPAENPEEREIQLP